MRRVAYEHMIDGRPLIAYGYPHMREAHREIICRRCGRPYTGNRAETQRRLCPPCSVESQPHVGYYAPRAALRNTGQGEWNKELNRLWRQAT